MFKKMTLLAVVLSLMVIAVPGVAMAQDFREVAPVDYPNANLYVIHGISGLDLDLEVDPALPVDILVNDEICALQGFKFGEIAGPLSLAPGAYNIKISLASEEACAKSPVIEADVFLAPNENATVIAHLTEKGDMTASKFTNDVSPTADRQSRLVVRHTAAVASVDIVAERIRQPVSSTVDLTKLTIEDLSNPKQAQADVRSGRWTATIYPAGKDTSVFGPVTLGLKASTGYFVYAVGSLENASFTLIVHTIPELG